MLLLSLLAACDGSNALLVGPPTTTTATSSSTTPVTTPTPTTVTDRVDQVGHDALDLLLVLDNSCSMQDDLEAMSEAVPHLFDTLLGSGVDYHVGIISMDMDTPGEAGVLHESEGVQWIEPGTADPVRFFSGIVPLSLTGSGIERGLEASWTALELLADTENAGFLRDDSAVHALVMSDEDDETNPLDLTLDEYVTWLLDLQAVRPDAALHAIVNTTPAPGAEIGERYIDVATQTGGLVYDLETVAYPDAMFELGLEVTGLTQTFCPSQAPAPGTLVVTVDDGGGVLTFADGVDYASEPGTDCITFFEYVPALGSTVVLDYEPL